MVSNMIILYTQAVPNDKFMGLKMTKGFYIAVLFYMLGRLLPLPFTGKMENVYQQSRIFDRTLQH